MMTMMTTTNFFETKKMEEIRISKFVEWGRNKDFGPEYLAMIFPLLALFHYPNIYFLMSYTKFLKNILVTKKSPF